MKKRLLIVEDEEIARTLYKRLLSGMGFDFDIVPSVTDGRKMIASANVYDLLVTDVRLPDGRGTDLIGEFHGRFPQGKVLVVTGSPELTLEDNEERMAFPAEWLYKPFELDDFTGAVKRLLS